MWKVMLECHSSQCQTVMEAKCLDANHAIAPNGKLDDAYLEVVIKVKLELQNWSLSFSSWIEAQRGYVKALNGWLRRCLQYEPEETKDDIAPLSSNNNVSGTPPVFLIVTRWSEAMDRLSEKEVVEAGHGLLTSINQVLEQHNADLQQRVTADKDLERKVKILEKEEQKMQKLMQARVKKMTQLTREECAFLLPKDSTRGSNDVKGGANLQGGLKQIFMAMEKLATHSRQAYEELHKFVEEGRAAQNKPECPAS